MNENATVVRADSASARDRAFFLHPATKLKKHHKKGPLVIKRTAPRAGTLRGARPADPEAER